MIVGVILDGLRLLQRAKALSMMLVHLIASFISESLASTVHRKCGVRLSARRGRVNCFKSLKIGCSTIATEFDKASLIR